MLPSDPFEEEHTGRSVHVDERWWSGRDRLDDGSEMQIALD